MCFFIVTECALFCTCGIITTGAGDVSIPTNFGTGGHLCIVILLIVTKSGFF